MKNNLRMPAEWERHGAVLMAWPHSATDWDYMLHEVQECYRQILQALSQIGERVILLAPANELPDLTLPGLTIVSLNTNDTWTRDYGPLTLQDTTGHFHLLDFHFNGWGQKFASNFDNQANRQLAQMGVYNHTPACHKDFVLEGGSIESDGQGTLLTTACCLMAPNRNEPMTRNEVELEVLTRLHGRKLLWLEHGSLAGDDTDGHIDTLCRLAPGNTIIYTGCQNPDDEHYADLTAMRNQLATLTNADGEAFNLIELPLPDAILDPEDGSRLPATYANYLLTERALLLPTYNQPMNDHLAQMTLQATFPNREIIPINCLPLVRQHGSLHCATMQLPLEVLA